MIDLIIEKTKNMEKTKIFEQDLCDQNNCSKHVGKFAVLFGGLDSSTPRAFMDKEVRKYVGDEPYVELVDIHLDNPWLRVIIKGINNLDFKEFEEQSL